MGGYITKPASVPPQSPTFPALLSEPALTMAKLASATLLLLLCGAARAAQAESAPRRALLQASSFRAVRNREAV